MRDREADEKFARGCLWALFAGLLLIALTVFIVAKVEAQTGPFTRTISWQPPTQYEDGGTLLLEELERYQFACNGTFEDYADPPEAEVLRTWISSASTQRVESFAVGEYTCALRVRAITTDSQAGDWSRWSNTATFTILAPVRRPDAPVLDVE